jgi:hypothetical protein
MINTTKYCAVEEYLTVTLFQRCVAKPVCLEFLNRIDAPDDGIAFTSEAETSL